MTSKFTYILFVCLIMGINTIKGQLINITDIVVSNNGDTLDISMQIEAKRLSVGCGGGYRLELAIENQDTRLLLPEVLYVSSSRNIIETRRSVLSNNYALPSYKTYNRVKKDKTYTTDYRISIPYYTWMKDAEIVYRHWEYGCRGDILLTQGGLNETIAPEPVIPEVQEWIPSLTVYKSMVTLLTPEVEQVKSRMELLRLYLEFPLNKFDIRPDYANNAHALTKVDTLITKILDRTHVTVKSIYITGYASPDGKYEHNEYLARNRSQAFERYIKTNYNLTGIPVNTTWVPEDWQGVTSTLDTIVGMPGRDKVVEVLTKNAHRDPDTREWFVRQIDNGIPRKFMLENIYPQLRRIELDVSYTVSEFSDKDAQQMIFRHPELLSLEEMFRVALMYAEDSEEYKKVYLIAAKHYPDNVVANNNAAAVYLKQGDATGAYPYIAKISGDPQGYINTGTYYYIIGEVEKAVEYFTKATESGNVKGASNLELLKQTVGRVKSE